MKLRISENRARRGPPAVRTQGNIKPQFHYSIGGDPGCGPARRCVNV